MSDIIRLLPDSVANQIAAGEVIQRPASIIKELVENAIDAGALHVDVLVEDAGRTAVQVIDDGKGMSETDARLAFERHATSKIQKADDLFSLHTMGFRGEALPSIVAVTQTTLRTRVADQELGTCLRVEGGKIVSQEVVSCPVGSNFLVQNLFYNVPARRKFLKSNQTELNNIVQEFERMALVNPSVSFTFSNNGTIVTSLPSSSTLQRIVGVFGKNIGSKLLSVDVETSLCKLSGFVGKPDSSRRKGSHQFFFVNGRYMRHPYFHKAVQEAFNGLIPETEQVPYFLYFDVDPANIDVNIHPTKTEIKFENEQAIWQIVVAAIKESLGRFNAVPVIEFDTEGIPANIPVYNSQPNRIVAKPEVKIDTNYNPFSVQKSSPARTEGQKDGNGISPRSVVPDFLYSDDMPFLDSPVNTANGVSQDGFASSENGFSSSSSSCPPSSNGFPSSSSSFPSSSSSFPSSSSSFPSNGFPSSSNKNVSLPNVDFQDIERGDDCYQFRGQYIMSSVNDGLLFVDQHRAHTRVLYNRYMTRKSEQSYPSQRLLFPELLQLSGSDAIVFEDMNDELRSLGFDVSPLGAGNYSILGVPSDLNGVDIVTLLNDMISLVSELGRTVREEVLSRMALAMAKKAAIPKGQVLSKQEMKELIDELAQTDNPNYTPDGKVILSVLPLEVIEKLFKKG